MRSLGSHEEQGYMYDIVTVFRELRAALGLAGGGGDWLGRAFRSYF